MLLVYSEKLNRVFALHGGADDPSELAFMAGVDHSAHFLVFFQVGIGLIERHRGRDILDGAIDGRRADVAGTGKRAWILPDELRGMAAECARQLAPYGKTIRDAVAFYVKSPHRRGERAD